MEGLLSSMHKTAKEYEGEIEKLKNELIYHKSILFAVLCQLENEEIFICRDDVGRFELEDNTGILIQKGGREYKVSIIDLQEYWGG